MILRLKFGREVEVPDPDAGRTEPPKLMLFQDEEDLIHQAQKRGISVEEMIEVAKRHNESVDRLYET